MSISRWFSRPAAWRALPFLTLLLMSGLIGACGLAARAQTATGLFYYGATGKRIPLAPSSKWLGVQLQAVADAGQVESRINALSPRGVDATQRVRRRNLLFFSLKSSSGVAARSNLAVRAGAAPGVRAVVRTFGESTQPMVEINQFVVRFKAGVNAAQLLASVNAVAIKPLGDFAPNGFLARLKDDAGTHAIDAANALYESGQTVWAQPNFIRPMKALQVDSAVAPRAAAPNDPLFGQQWHLRNVGQNGGVAGADIKALQAWDITRGSTAITIAVIDTGIDINHEDLKTKIVAGTDVVDDDADPSPDPANDNFDSEDHGTACSGLAAAATGNSLGVAGVAPNCKIMPIRALAPGQTDANFADAFYFAARNNADVISNSYGPNAAVAELPAVLQSAIHYAVISGRGGKGCVVLFAAGNDADSGQSTDTDGYASNPDVITVGATTNLDKRASYSETGTSLDITAPGGDLGTQGTLLITTTDRTGFVGYSSDNYATDFDGTSAATPIAAGVAALMLSLKPELTATQVQAIMQSTADKVGDTAYDSNGRNDEFGYGRVNAYNALLEVRKQLFSVQGRVTTADGTAVAGVTIQARVANADGSFGPLKSSTVTNSAGQYTFSNLSGGPTLLVAAKSGLAFRTTVAPVTPFYTVDIKSNLPGENFLASAAPVVTLEEPPADSSVPRPFPTLPTPQPSATPYPSTYTPLIASTTNNFDVTKMNFFYHFPDQAKPNTPSRAIPDNDPAGVSSDFTFDGAGTVGDAIVSLNISHTFVSDLVIKLTAPDGTSKTFFNRDGGEDVNLVRSFTVSFTNAPVTGKWTVNVSDQAADDTGTFNSCTLTLRPTRVPIATATEVVQGKWRAAWNTARVTRGTYVVGATAVAYSGNPTDENNNVVVRAPNATLSGHILTSNGSAIPNVLVQATLSGSTTPLASARTDSSGIYRLEQLAPGTYVITPTLSNTVFDPTSRTVTVGGTNISTVDFTATVQDTVKPTISISSPRNYGVFRFSVASVSGTVSDDRSGVKSVVGVLFRDAQTTAQGTRPAGFYNGTNFSEATYNPATQNRPATLSGTGLTRTWNLPFPRLETGRYFFVATASDNVGNMASAPRIRFDVDTTAPAITVSTPTADGSYTSAPQATGTATDVGTGVRAVTVLLFSYGSGNNPPAGYYNGTTFTTTYNAATQQRPATLTRNGDVTNWSLTLPTLKPGRYYVRPRAIDVAGNFRYAAAVSFTITAAAAPGTQSSVQFSSVSATGSEVRLSFSGNLDKAATDAANYAVTVNGQAVEVSGDSLSGGTVTLSLASGVASGAQVAVSWSGLSDASGRALKSGHSTITAR